MKPGKSFNFATFPELGENNEPNQVSYPRGRKIEKEIRWVIYFPTSSEYVCLSMKSFHHAFKAHIYERQHVSNGFSGSKLKSENKQSIYSEKKKLLVKLGMQIHTHFWLGKSKSTIVVKLWRTPAASYVVWEDAAVDLPSRIVFPRSGKHSLWPKQTHAVKFFSWGDEILLFIWLLWWVNCFNDKVLLCLQVSICRVFFVMLCFEFLIKSKVFLVLSIYFISCEWNSIWNDVLNR